MPSTSYLTLVNNSIQEGGIDLATFVADGSDWTTNTNAMMNRFKVWVQRGWKDIQQEAFDWDFMSEQGIVNIDPGFMFYTTDGTAISTFQSLMPAGTVFSLFDQNGVEAVPQLIVKYITDQTGQETLTLPYGTMTLDTAGGVMLNFGLKPVAEYMNAVITTFTINMTWTPSAPAIGTHLLINPVITNGTSPEPGFYPVIFNGTVAGGVNRFTFVTPADAVNFGNFVKGQTAYQQTGIYTADGNTLLGLEGDFTYPVVGGLNGYVHSWKSFDIANEENQDRDFVEDVQEIDQSSFRIVDFYAPPPAGEIPLTFVPWDTFNPTYDISATPPGTPRLITKDNTGKWRLYPHPYYTYTLKFDYMRQPQILSLFEDIPKGLEDDFVDIIMWKALIYYGEYDEQPSVVQRATKNYKQLLSRIELKNRDKFHFRPHRMW